MNNIHTYEEAREYLKKDIGGAYDRYLKKTAKRNALIIAVGSAAFAIIGLVSGHPELAWFILGMLAWALCSFLGVVRRRADIMEIKNGSYFKIKKPEEVIAQANRQINISNEYDNLE